MAIPELRSSASRTLDLRWSLGDATRQAWKPTASLPQDSARIYSRSRGAGSSNTAPHLDDTRSISIGSAGERHDCATYELARIESPPATLDDMIANCILRVTRSVAFSGVLRRPVVKTPGGAPPTRTDVGSSTCAAPGPSRRHNQFLLFR